MNVRFDLTDLATDQFYSLPIVLQTPLDEYLARRAAIETARNRGLPARRFVTRPIP